MSRTISGGPIQRTVSRVKEKNNIDEQTSLNVLFPDSFMKEHTRFSSIEEFFENGSFIYNSNEVIEPVEDLNDHIFITTDFNTWEEMLEAAAKGYSARAAGHNII